MKRRAALFLAVGLAVVGCGVRSDRPPATSETTPPTPEGPTSAADSIIQNASSPEEKAALEKARDDVDAEMREKARALDAEIERLRKENAALKGSQPH